MAKCFASWVPGYAVVAEKLGDQALNPGGWSFGDCNGHRVGPGVYFYLKGGHDNWFHAPIPTPVLVEDRRARLGRVMVLYSFPQGAALHDVHVWDGPNTRILTLEGLSITGDHTTLDGDNTWDVGRDILWGGVGISLHVSAVQDATLFFGGVGADFYHDI